MNRNDIIILSIVIIFLSNVNKKIIYLFFLLFILYILYKYYDYNITNTENKDINEEELSDIYDYKNKVKKEKDIIPDNIDNIFKKIEKYSKYNINDFVIGRKYLNKFFKNINTLENENLKEPQIYIDDCLFYLKKSINHLQYIVNSVNDYNLIEQKKYNDFKITKKANKLSKLLKNLYENCNGILTNIINNLDIPYNSGINQPEAFNNINQSELY